MQLRSLAFLVLALGCSSQRSKEPAAVAQDPSAILKRVRQSAPVLSSFGRQGASKLVQIALPTRSDAPARIGPDAARTLSIRALDVASVPARAVDGTTLFAAARPSLDVFFASGVERFEEVRVLHDEKAPSVARWSLEAGEAIVDVRLDGKTLQAFDKAGHVVVRTDPMFAVDARGVRREPKVTLVKGERGWTLTADLDRAGLDYPIVLDPIWLYGPTTSAAHTQPETAKTSDGKVYLAGGGPTFEVFDPATTSFKKLADFPATTGIVEALYATSTGRLRALSSGTVYTYTPSSDTWTTGAAFTTGHSFPTYLQLSDDRILAIGGDASDASSNKVDVYTPSTDTWASTGALGTARAGANAIQLASGKVFVFGGMEYPNFFSTSEIWDSTAGTWSAGPSASFAVTDPWLVALGSGKVAIASGNYDAGGPYLWNFKTGVYDPTAGTIAGGPTFTASHDDGAFLAVGNRLFAIGGVLGTESASGAVDVAEFPSAWSKTTSLLVPRHRASAVELNDGRVLVVGGIGGMLTGSVTQAELLSSFTDGTKCVFGQECASGNCVSGVCCATACTGACERCDVAGSVGTCKPAPAKTACGAAAGCSGSTLTVAGQCDGAATTCPSATSTACPGALNCADAFSCKAFCVKNDDCTTNACDVASGLCVLPSSTDAGTTDSGTTDSGAVDEDASSAAPVPEGAPKVVGSAQRCIRGDECSTGFCVDGVCCDSDCKDRCHSCALPGSPGRCTEEPIGVDLRAECGPALSCSGTCGKGGVCTANTTNSQCAPSVCTGATTGKGAAYCKGRGIACKPEEAQPFDCGEYICDPAFGACRTSCTSSDGCASGYLCNLDSKRCEPLPAEDDSGCAISQPGRSGQLSLGLLLALSLLARRRWSRVVSRQSSVISREGEPRHETETRA